MRPLHHLIAVVVCVQGPVVLQGGAGSEDDLRVEAERPQWICLLQPVTRQSAPKALWDTGGDGEGVVLIAFLSRKIIRMLAYAFCFFFNIYITKIKSNSLILPTGRRAALSPSQSSRGWSPSPQPCRRALPTRWRWRCSYQRWGPLLRLRLRGTPRNPESSLLAFSLDCQGWQRRQAGSDGCN